MLVDFDEPVRDLAGKPVKPDSDEPMTLGTCAIGALQHLFVGEDASEQVKVRRFKLAVRIAQATQPLELSNDEVTTLKLVVGKFWNPLVVGRLFQAIDPESMKA
jgi:hypothetical protein